jgi:hypothetical protein
MGVISSTFTAHYKIVEWVEFPHLPTDHNLNEENHFLTGENILEDLHDEFLMDLSGDD